MRASSVKSGITAATRKRNASAKYEPNTPRKSLNASQAGILKSNKSRKGRPQTAAPDRLAHVYDPNRARKELSPATHGPNHSPFVVPNAARVDAQSYGGGRAGANASPLRGSPRRGDELGGMKGGRQSPLRAASPRRSAEIRPGQASLGGASGRGSYENLPGRSGSPLRTKSPRKDLSEVRVSYPEMPYT